MIAPMVERMAEAMFQGDWKQTSPRMRLAYRTMARIALSELLEPTEFMVSAGTVQRYHFSVAENGQASCTEIFRAMVRAAINEDLE